MTIDGKKGNQSDRGERDEGHEADHCDVEQ
jgi:hypothetical protein